MAYTPQDVVEDVRFYIGKVSCDWLDDQVIYDIMVRQESDQTRPDASKCTVTFKTIKETLRYLIRNYQSILAEASGSSGAIIAGGEIEEIEESIGKRKKRIKYSTSSSSSSNTSSTDWKTHWQELLEYYETTGPSSIGCSTTTDPTDPTEASGIVKIGVSKSKWDTATPWRQNLNRSCPFKY